MKLLYKILVAFIIITLIINGFIYFTFFITFQKTNHQNQNIYEVSKILYEINNINEQNLILSNAVSDYVNGDVDSEIMLRKLDNLKNSIDTYLLFHKSGQAEETAQMNNFIEIMRRDIKKIIQLKKDYSPKLNSAIITYELTSAELEKDLRHHYGEYEAQMDVYNSEFDTQYTKGLELIVMSSIMMFLFAVILGVLVTYQIIKPINHIIDISKKVSKGEDAKTNINSDDEFGDMGFAFNMMIDKIYNKNNELGSKVKDLEKFTKLVVDRELEMIELKKKIERFEKK